MRFKPVVDSLCQISGFKSRKAAQISAFFSSQSAQKTIEKLKLVKLIYLSEREFMAFCGFPMLYDELFSLPHGPVCSGALNGINGKIDTKIWSKFIRTNGNLIKAAGDFQRDNYDELSDAEIDTLTSVWTSFGWMSASQIRNYTHKHCPEYVEVDSGRLPIAYRDVFKAIGMKNPEELEREVDIHRRTCSMMSA